MYQRLLHLGALADKDISYSLGCGALLWRLRALYRRHKNTPRARRSKLSRGRIMELVLVETIHHSNKTLICGHLIQICSFLATVW